MRNRAHGPPNWNCHAMLFIFYILQFTVYSSTEIATRAVNQVACRSTGQLVRIGSLGEDTQANTPLSAPTTTGSHLNRCPPKCSTATRRASKWMLPTIGLQNPMRWSVASTNSRTLPQRRLAIFGDFLSENGL